MCACGRARPEDRYKSAPRQTIGDYRVPRQMIGPGLSMTMPTLPSPRGRLGNNSGRLDFDLRIRQHQSSDTDQGRRWAVLTEIPLPNRIYLRTVVNIREIHID